MEYLSRIKELVVRVLFCGFIVGVPCNYAVNESIGKGIFSLYPVYKTLTEIPELGILKNALLKLITVVVDKLCR